MKISLEWLSDFIAVDEFKKDPQSLAKILTNAGLEVESIEEQAKPFQNVVIGSILEKGKHPNADRLSLCQVATGDGVVHQIVCGAQNHKQGDRVVVALPGAVLPGEFAIKHAKVRGVESGGMLCSEKELGLLKDPKAESEGILLLPTDAPIGKPYAEFAKLNDVIIEIKVTANRADCLSHYGLALELSCLLGRPLKKAENPIKIAAGFKGGVSVTLKALDLGPRYAGRAIRGVKVGPSPEWLKRRLESVGMNSINNVVDVTNYVMMELGQPLHAFDVREIKGGTISVDRAKQGESFTTLDGTELKLDGTELTIRDRDRAVALAGVIGGKNSGVLNDTTDIFIESAYFTPGAVRRTMRKFGLQTDSGYRFARGVNPESTADVLDRATSLMIQVAGGEAAEDRIDEYPQPVQRPEINVSVTTVESRLGYRVEPARFEHWINRLGGDLKALGPGVYKFKAPAYRPDLQIEMDMVEEFARLEGYDKIPDSLPSGSFHPAQDDAISKAEVRVRRLLQGLGCQQALNYAFIGDRFQKEFLGDVTHLNALGLHVASEDVRLVNPLNEEINVMRRSLLPGLYRNAIHNIRSGNSSGRLIEVGVSHHRAIAGRSERFQGTAFGEENRLGFCFWGGDVDLWGRSKPAETAMILKGVVESFLSLFGIQKVRFHDFKEGHVPSFLHPGKCASVTVDGVAVGFLGAVHPSRLDGDKVRVGLAVAEFSLERLMKQTQMPSFKAISQYPAMERDVAFVGDREIAAGDMIAEIRAAARRLEGEGGKWLEDTTVFDVFEGAALNGPNGEKKRSVAVRMVYRSVEGTLEEAAISAFHGKLVNAVCQKFGVVVRG